MTKSGSVLDGVIISGNPLVSVCVITYNHEKYIHQCLDGILMQKVNFPYEILIHDDASPDHTADIIREYEAKYPEIIKPICRTENLYSKDVDISRFNFERACGKYIAQCEGDDYWTDPNKLQMQVNFLEEHPEYVETGHNISVLSEKGYLTNHPASISHERVYTIDDLKKGKLWMVATASAVYRNIFKKVDIKTLEMYYTCKANGDLKISLLLSQYGNCYVFAKQMSVYRYITSHGTSWNARASGKNMAKFWYDSYLSAVLFMKNAFNIDVEFKPLFRTALYDSCINFVRFAPKRDSENTKILAYISKSYGKMYGVRLLLFGIYLYIPIRIVQKALRLLLSKIFSKDNNK